MSRGITINLMAEKRMNSKLTNIHGGVSTGGLKILARIMAKHHLLQLKTEHAVQPSVPSGQAEGQAGGQTTDEEINESADKDLDPKV